MSDALKAYICQKHGRQECIGMKMTVTQNSKTVEREYCMDCWVEMMDQHCCQLVPDGESNRSFTVMWLEAEVK